MTVPATPRFCAACGVPRQWGGRFCGGCGASLLENSGSTPSAPSAPPGPSRPVLDLAALSPIPILKDRSLWRPPVVAFGAAAITPFVLVQYGMDRGTSPRWPRASRRTSRWSGSFSCRR